MIFVPEKINFKSITVNLSFLARYDYRTVPYRPASITVFLMTFYIPSTDRPPNRYHHFIYRYRSFVCDDRLCYVR